jgi:ATP-binding cassette subfamily B protein
MLLERAVRVELVTIEDSEFHNRLSTGRQGAEATRRVTERAVGMCSGLVSIISAISVLAVLNPLLTPLLFLTLAPRAWSVARTVGARHTSMKRWMELTRQLDLLAQLMTQRESAEEVRAHRVGGFLLAHYRRLATRSEDEQARLARKEAGTRLVAGGVGGLASLVTYGVLLLLVIDGRMTFPVAGTAAFAIRSSISSLVAFMMQFQQLYQDGLLIIEWRDACEQAEAEAIATRGPSPAPRVQSISTRGLRFVYPGAKRPALNGVDIDIRRGEVVALVGENGIFNRITELTEHDSTVILITHRLASVARADRIYVLDSGRVVEHGTHAELMSAAGAYAAMYRLQAAQFQPT